MLARFDALVDRIYDTVASPPAWRATLTGIADALASSSGVLMGVSFPQQRVLWNHLGRYDPASARTFCDRHFHNPLMKVVPGRPAGDIVFVDEALPADRLRRTPFWDEVLHPYDIAHVAVVPLSTQPECLAAFNIFRSPAQGPFTSHDRSSLERLTPHMRRALQLQLRVEGYQQLVTGAFAALDQLAVGVVVLSGSGAVAFANRRARQMHAAGGPILLRDGTVVARGAAPSAALRRLIAGAVDGGAGGALQLEG
ncbi:hypothetical protein, partial [Reyranella sp. CPCC 100927]|uniref:hypothetical protein n=1 Tax=Reyranella sp. CPCC 100927 TaxID=2599616 RepID=UPI0011B85A8B